MPRSRARARRLIWAGASATVLVVGLPALRAEEPSATAEGALRFAPTAARVASGRTEREHSDPQVTTHAAFPDPWAQLDIAELDDPRPAVDELNESSVLRRAATIRPQNETIDGATGGVPSASSIRGTPPATDAPVTGKAAVEPSAEVDRSVTAEDAAGRRLARRSRGLEAVSDGESPARAETGWVRTIGSLAAVVALILMLAWGYRVVAAGGRMRTARGRQSELLEVLARTSVSARQSVCLLRVGPRLILIGVGADRLTTLDVIADADTTARLAGRAAQNGDASHSAEFERCLEREARTYTEQDVPNEIATPDEAKVSAIRRTLQAAAARLQKANASRAAG